MFDAIINFVPPPEIVETNKPRGLIFDSTFDQYRGVIPYIRMVDGYLEKGMKAKYFSNGVYHEITEVGILKLNKTPVKRLEAGDVGYIITNLKNVKAESFNC